MELEGNIDDKFVDDPERQSYGCNLCGKLSLSVKRGMWVCCGVTSCIGCIADNFQSMGNLTCIWCGAFFGEEWDLMDVIQAPLNAKPVIQTKDLVCLWDELREKGNNNLVFLPQKK